MTSSTYDHITYTDDRTMNSQPTMATENIPVAQPVFQSGSNSKPRAEATVISPTSREHTTAMTIYRPNAPAGSRGNSSAITPYRNTTPAHTAHMQEDPIARKQRRRRRRHARMRGAAVGGAVAGGIVLGPLGLVLGGMYGAAIAHGVSKSGELRKDARVARAMEVAANRVPPKTLTSEHVIV